MGGGGGGADSLLSEQLLYVDADLLQIWAILVTRDWVITNQKNPYY